MIDLDANATTAMLPEVLEEMMPWLRGGYANPSGAYAGAKLARKAINRARQQVAQLIGADESEIIFTGSGTESVNTALHSLNLLTGEGAALVSLIEHSAVLRCVENFSRPVKKVAVRANGCVDLVAFENALELAAYGSIMAANNETGMIQPIVSISGMMREWGLVLHTDAIQAAGKMPINVREWGVDLLSLSAHKFHGPKGVGALFVREGLRFSPLLHGGGQEFGRRSGTENTAGIVAMGAAAAIAHEFLTTGGAARVAALRDAFEVEVLREITGVTVNGDPDQRLTNTSHLSFELCDAAGLLILLDEMGVACSAGSACMTGRQQPSHVQVAMGISEARAKSSLRLSFSRLNTMEEALTAAHLLKRAVEKLRRVQGAGVGPVAIYTAVREK